MKFLSLILLMIFPFVFHSQNTDNNLKQSSLDSIQQIQEVLINANLILGNKFMASERTGSAYFIDSLQLRKMGYIDVNRILASVPGLTVVDEEGFGLRPNISLRGTSPERSAKITLMEDGVLIAPAPYSAPAAYYFPTVGRMQSIEILKGSSQIQHGPFTTGGAINFVSQQIPEAFRLNAAASYGSFENRLIRVNTGNNHKIFAYNVEYMNLGSNGFKELPNGGKTGFDKNDLVAKFKLHTPSEFKLAQSLEFKFQYSDESSHETYLGLTDADFDRMPFARYAASQNDLMTNEHLQFMVTHNLSLSRKFKWSTTAYYNDFFRNWYKLNDVIANDEKIGIEEILSHSDAYADHFDLITGQMNSQEGVLGVKANNRNYLSKGIQTKLDYHFYTGQIFHDIEVGARIHYDEEDRYQWEDYYAINDSDMTIVTEGLPGSDSNRISSATAFSSFVLYKLKFKGLTLTPGLRYENIALERIDYGKNDPNRIGTELQTRNNDISIFIPGIGMNYKFNNYWSIFGGVHKGFSPPGNATGQKPEESINYELGGRIGKGPIRAEVVGFFNNYSNLLGSDLTASGGSGTLDQFNAGEAHVKGLEILFNYDVLVDNEKFNLPFTIGYTYTDTEFRNSFDSEDGIWGSISEGDEIPYISKHQGNSSLSLEHERFEISINSRFNGAFRTVSGSGSIPADQKVDAFMVFDLSTRVKLTNYLDATGSIINLFDNKYAVSRVPSGLRPGHPFGFNLGLALNL